MAISIDACTSDAIILKMLTIILLILLGWVVGAFINYISDVMPIRRRLVAPFCQACDSRIPLLNYFLWPRRCLSCDTLRTRRVWVVEIGILLATIWLWTNPASRLGFIPGLMVLAYFSIVAVIDLEHRLILHPISLVGVILGIFIGIWLHGWLSTLIGGLVGFGIMLALFSIGVVFVRTIVRKRRPEFDEEPLGFGDVILSGILGLFVGWPGIVLCLIVGILIAGLGALIYILGRMVTHHYQSFDFVPYGPFLLAGAFILLFLRDHLVALASP